MFPWQFPPVALPGRPVARRYQVSAQTAASPGVRPRGHFGHQHSTVPLHLVTHMHITATYGQRREGTSAEAPDTPALASAGVECCGQHRADAVDAGGEVLLTIAGDQLPGVFDQRREGGYVRFSLVLEAYLQGVDAGDVAVSNGAQRDDAGEAEHCLGQWRGLDVEARRELRRDALSKGVVGAGGGQPLAEVGLAR